MASLPLFDESKHRRDLRGRFKDKLKLPDPIWKQTRRQVLGGARDTKELWTRWSPGAKRNVYRDSRRPLHDAIIHASLSGKHPNGGKPRVTFLVGGPGSGKSTVLADRPDVTTNAVMVDPDVYKMALPEWDPLADAGDRDVAKLTHEESRDIASAVQYAAQEAGLDVVIDGTGAGPSFPDRLAEWAARGYDVHVLWVDADTDLALDRVHKRGEETGRALPDNLVRLCHRDASRISLPYVVGGRHVASVQIYNNDSEPKLIYERRGDAESILDLDAIKKLYEKAKQW